MISSKKARLTALRLRPMMDRGDLEGFVDVLTALSLEDRAQVMSSCDPRGRSTLFWLLHSGRMQLLEAALSLCNITEISATSSNRGESPLHAAVASGNPKMVTAVLSLCDPDSLQQMIMQHSAGCGPPFFSGTPFHWAVRSGNANVLRVLVDRFAGIGEQLMGFIFTHPDQNSCTTLGLAISSQSVEMVDMLLNMMGAHDDIPKNSLINDDGGKFRGQSLLHEAVSTGNPKIMRRLLRDIPRVLLNTVMHKCDLLTETPLDRAARSGNAATVRMLVRGLGDLYPDFVRRSFPSVLRSNSEGNDADKLENIPASYRMRLFNNAVASRSPSVLRELLAPLSVRDRCALLTNPGWNYPLSPLQQAFSSGETECLRVMLDSLVGPRRDCSYVVEALASCSAGLTAMHCAVNCDVVRLIGDYRIPPERLVELLTTTVGGEAVPDGMNPVQMLVAGPQGDGRPVPGFVEVMKTTLSLLKGKPSLIQRVLAATDVYGRSTLHLLTSAMGSQYCSDADFISLCDYLVEQGVNVTELLRQEVNGQEGTSPLDTVSGMENALYSWSYRVSDYCSQLIRKQETMTKNTIPRMRKRRNVMSSIALASGCVGALGVIVFFSSQMASEDAGAQRVLLLMEMLCGLLLTLSCVLLEGFSFLEVQEIPQLLPDDQRPNIGVETCNSSCIAVFDPKNILKVEPDRSGVRSSRDPLRFVSHSPSATSLEGFLGDEIMCTEQGMVDGETLTFGNGRDAVATTSMEGLKVDEINTSQGKGKS